MANERPASAYLVIALGENRIAIDAGAIDEICELPEAVPIPRVPPHIPGLFALRG